MLYSKSTWTSNLDYTYCNRNWPGNIDRPVSLACSFESLAYTFSVYISLYHVYKSICHMVSSDLLPFFGLPNRKPILSHILEVIRIINRTSNPVNWMLYSRSNLTRAPLIPRRRSKVMFVRDALTFASLWHKLWFPLALVAANISNGTTR